MAEHKLHSISRLFISQVMIPQVMLLVFLFLFFPVYIPRVLNTGTCIQPGDLFYSAALHRNENIRRGFEKNADEWTGKVEIIKEDIPGTKRGMYGYILTYSRL